MCSLVSHTQAETRAEFAERSVAKLEKTIDDLEGMILSFGIVCFTLSFCRNCTQVSCVILVSRCQSWSIIEHG